MKKLKAKIVSYKEKNGKYVPAFLMRFFDGQRENTLRIDSLDQRFDTKKETNSEASSDIKYFSK